MIGSLSTIRIRLGAALALALLPVLLVAGLQSALAFQRESSVLRDSLASAAQRSASTAQARLEAADVLLQTLAPQSIGMQCAQRLTEVTRRIPGYANLIRFDRRGRVACAAADVPADPIRASRDWFKRLAEGDSQVVRREPSVAYAAIPHLLAAVPAKTPDGAFDGALVAVISLASLQPRTADRSLPAEAEVALVDDAGQIISATDPTAFGPMPSNWRRTTANATPTAWYARDRGEVNRLYSAAPLVGDEVYVVLSARSRDLFTWAALNPLLGLVFPLVTFALALAAVWVVADQVVTRWITYLQRIAELYARGRFTVRPIQAGRAPLEIRALASTLEHMADGIVARDASLRDSLAQKDALLREIHHRVKNNLQVISSLLNMQQRAMVDPAARAAMSDTRQRITALALIYRTLYQGVDMKSVDLRPFLEELTAQLITGDLSRGPQVRTEMSVDTLMIDPDRLAPLALFAVEAITNAQKHAFAGRGGVLTVDFHVVGEVAELRISDDGAAVNENLVATGVGRTLMTAFARQLRGEASLERIPGGGVCARLSFPTPALERLNPPLPIRNQAVA